MTAILSKSSDRTSNHICLPSIRWQTYRAIADDLVENYELRITNYKLNEYYRTD